MLGAKSKSPSKAKFYLIVSLHEKRLVGVLDSFTVSQIAVVYRGTYFVRNEKIALCRVACNWVQMTVMQSELLIS